MFYKIKGISPKTGKGTVSVVYRQTGANPFETVKATGVSVAPQDFDMKTGRVKPRLAEHPELNAKIQQVANDLEEAVRNVATGKSSTNVTPIAAGLSKANVDAEYKRIQDFREAMQGLKEAFPEHLSQEQAELRELEAKVAQRRAQIAQMKRGMTELGAYDEPSSIASPITDRIAAFLKDDTQHYRPSTKRGYEDLASMLRTWKPSLKLEEIDLKVFQDFQKHLVQLGMRNGSVRTIMQRFRTMYRLLIVGTSLSSGFLADFKGLDELFNDEVIYLTPEEVEMIAALPLSGKAQKQIRLQFLLACEIGLRHKDLMRLAPNHITGDTITIVTYKKNITAKPPITKKARAILEVLELPLREYHINHYNKVIRAICMKLEHFHQPVTLTHYVNNTPVESTLPKWQLMSSHVARKTAINNWLAKGVRESVVAQWAGHKNTKMIQKHYQNKEAAAQQELHKVLD